MKTSEAFLRKKRCNFDCSKRYSAAKGPHATKATRSSARSIPVVLSTDRTIDFFSLKGLNKK